MRQASQAGRLTGRQSPASATSAVTSRTARLPTRRSGRSAPTAPASMTRASSAATSAAIRAGSRARTAELGGQQLAEGPADAAHGPVKVGAERVVLHQVGPGGSGTLQAGRAEVGAVGSEGNRLEGFH